MGDKEIIVSSDECLEMLEFYKKYNDMTLAYKAYKESNLYVSLNVFQSIITELLKETQNEENGKNDVKVPIELIDLTDDDVIEDHGVASKDCTTKEETYLAPIDKLLQVPIVYTTKLDDMPIFKHRRYLQYSQKQNIIYSIISQSTPHLNKDEFKPNKTVNHFSMENYNKMVELLQLVFERTSFDRNNDELDSRANSPYDENVENYELCKPLSIILEDFMKSPKLLADITKKGITFNKECLNSAQPIHSLENKLPKAFKNFRNRYWLLCDKTAKEVLWDLYFITAAGNVNFVILNQNQQKKDDVLMPMFISRGIINIEICCWFKRKTFLNSMKNSHVISSDAIVIMSKLHNCVQCNCCCSSKIIKSDIQSIIKELSSNSNNEPVVNTTAQTKTSPNDKCLTPYNEILKSLVEVTKGCSMIDAALRYNIPALKSTRENIKLDGDIKIYKSSNVDETIDKSIMSAGSRWLDSQEDKSRNKRPDPILIDSQIPNNNSPKRRKNQFPAEVDFETQIPLFNVSSKYTSELLAGQNMNALPVTPAAVMPKRTQLSLKPPPLQPILPSLQPIPNLFQSVTVNVPQNNASTPYMNTDNNTVNTIVQAILETFKHVRLNIDENGKVAAVLPKPVEHLTTAELKILRHVLNLAETQVQELKLNPGAELMTNINFLNETEIINNMTAAENHDGSVSLAFNASVDTQVQVQAYGDHEEISHLPQYDVEESILPDLENQLTLPKIENVFSLQEAFHCIKQDISENVNQSENDPLGTSLGDESFNDNQYLRKNEVKVDNDGVDVEMCEIEKVSNERKRKSPVSKEYPKIRLVSPSKLGIQKDKSRSEPVAGPSIMIIPPTTLQKWVRSITTGSSPILLNDHFEQSSEAIGPAAAPVILNHQIDNTTLHRKTSPITDRNTSVVSIDKKGDIKKWWKQKPS